MTHNLCNSYSGNLAQELRTNACDTVTFVGMKTDMPKIWEDVRHRFEHVMQHISIRKYDHHEWSTFYGKESCSILRSHHGQQSEEWFGLKKCLMPLPAAVLAFPIFRYVPYLASCSLFSFF